VSAGAEDIKKHPWFEGINWALLRHQPPPYVPRRANAAATAAAAATTAGSGFKDSDDADLGAGTFDNY
jgi:hypothetical protein